MWLMCTRGFRYIQFHHPNSLVAVVIVSHVLQLRKSRLELSNVPKVTHLVRDRLRTVIQVMCLFSALVLSTARHLDTLQLLLSPALLRNVMGLMFFGGALYAKLNYFGMSLTEAGVLA